MTLIFAAVGFFRGKMMVTLISVVWEMETLNFVVVFQVNVICVVWMGKMYDDSYQMISE